MKPINETLYAIPVPMDAEEIDKQELIDGWFELFYTTPSDSNFHYNRMNFNFTILGTITRTECDFDLTKIVSHCPIEGRFLKFQSLIEAKTGYLFENSIVIEEDSAYDRTSENYQNLLTKWQEHQNRVVEKLLIIENK